MTFGTKAETLARLVPRLERAAVLPLLYFTVADWQADPAAVLDKIQARFPEQLLVIRSSTLAEDGAQQSMAGAFRSCLSVDSGARSALTEAMNQVVASYGPQGGDDDQVLIQPMLVATAVSGVITTYGLHDGAPYYVINYDDESGRTDTITGGTGVNKTVLVYRNTDLALIDSPRIRRWVALAQELEAHFGKAALKHGLDIEFAQNLAGKLFVLQVRPLTTSQTWQPELRSQIDAAQHAIAEQVALHSQPRAGLGGSRTLLGEMPDWNPAEMIGTSPRPLAYSLYCKLITDDVWRRARQLMGYRYPDGEALMQRLGGHPYIDVRNSFNSLLPASLDEPLAHRLVNAWLDRLTVHPELHDKVEFEVAHTALDFAFHDQIQTRYSAVLSADDIQTFEAHLRTLTRGCLDVSPSGTLAQAMAQAEELAAWQSSCNLIDAPAQPLPELCQTIQERLDRCRAWGTLPFAVVARHAFIAEALLRSAVARGALMPDRLACFRQSLHTITHQMSLDFWEAYQDRGTARQQFLATYGHLRPGTYDILSRRYDQRDDLFTVCQLPPPTPSLSLSPSDLREPFTLTPNESQALATLLDEAGLNVISPESLMSYARQAMVGREQVKFIFTRSLSEVLELLAGLGEQLGLSRETLSYLPIETVLTACTTRSASDATAALQEQADAGRSQTSLSRSLRLGYLIRDVRDVFVIPLHRSAPNFITDAIIEAPVVLLDTHHQGDVALQGKIVCIENADPGFDWIFIRGIAGLVTQFGGSNSHMAIRCAEFGLPAAIGCGEQTFERLVSVAQGGHIYLNCANKIVRPVYG